MEKIRVVCQTANFNQAYTIFRQASVRVAPKRLLLLHGAGVAGELTWTFVANYLTEWDEIYIPDLAGMGEASFLATSVPSLMDYCQQLDELLEHWSRSLNDFDCAGYSFGGMLLECWLRERSFQNLVFLLEPAMLLSKNWQQLLEKSQKYQQIADEIRSGMATENSYRSFLDSVSPQRATNPQSDRLTIQRLQANALGFSQCLQAVAVALSEEGSYYCDWRSPWKGASFVGELSWPEMHQRHEILARLSDDWHFVVAEQADHSLVFTRPRSIAKVMNALAKSS